MEYAEVLDSLPYREANPDTLIVSARDSFWTHVEVEYKIATQSPGCEDALRGFRSGDYSMGALHRRTSFERHLRFSRPNGQVFHVAVLGKRGSGRPMAIKFKCKLAHGYPEGFHVRRVAILPYSAEALRHTVESHLGVPWQEVSTQALPSFFNLKTRRIAVHRSMGLVYCLSYGLARPSSRSLPPRAQFEIEYWSRISPASESQAIGSHRLYQSHSVDLARSFVCHLRARGIHAGPSDTTRSEWLEIIAEKRRGRFRLP